MQHLAHDGCIRVIVLAAVPATVDAFLVEQIKGLEANGYEVTVVCSPGDAVSRLQGKGLRCLPVLIPRAIRPMALLAALARLIRIFRELRPQVIHTHTPVAAFLGQLAGWFVRVPIRITTIHGLIFAIEPRPVMRRLYHILELRACRWATKVISVSQEDARHLVEDCGLPASKVEVLNVGINLETYDARRLTAEEKASVRQELGIPADAFVFGSVSRLTRVKGIMEWLEAFASLSRRHENVYLLHIGPPDDVRGHGVSAADATRFGCEGKCRFAGMRYDVWRLLGAMDVFCLPSRFEGYPASLMEAAAMGLPSIATDIRGSREAVLDGVTGLLVKPQDPQDLEAAMERLLSNPVERREMGERARARALAEFDRTNVVRKTREIYEQEVREHLR
jgi:glycosyltransferase involved in cell wall biosynthesis